MSENNLPASNLVRQYPTYDRQKCFVACSNSAPWTEDLLTACEEVLTRPEFNLEPAYAGRVFDPGMLVQQKALELIANARYGIYDLSCWQNERGEWQPPRNVYIELGMAIALNRPTLLLRNKRNRHLKLPECLESMSGLILEFGGTATLRRTLETRLPQWLEAPPEVGWWNRYCVPGNRICEFRESHPRASQWGQKTLQCHISDGPDEDREDFRAVVEDVLERFRDVRITYLDALSPMRGYDFMLCSHCKTVRFSSFAIYRITPNTPAETFIAIGISLVLEQQFEYKIPKLLFIEKLDDLPSLLKGYEVVVASSDLERKDQLRKFMPMVMQRVREATWKPRPLPFVEITCAPQETIEILADSRAPVEETQAAEAGGPPTPEEIREPIARASGEKYYFEEFELDTMEGVLRREGNTVVLTPKQLQALELLVRRAGYLVSHSEMVESLWPGLLGQESSLRYTISMLRRVLGESDNGTKFIQTVRSRGYRFVAEVNVGSRTEASRAVRVKTVICQFCNGRIAADDIFCTHCGARQAIRPKPIADKAIETLVGNAIAALVIGAEGPDSLRVFPLRKESNLIGRADPVSKIFPEVDLTAWDPESKISRRHARIWRAGSGFLVEDLGSVNATIINDYIRLPSTIHHPLVNGDRLRLGQTTLTFWVSKTDQSDDDSDWRNGIAASRSDL